MAHGRAAATFACPARAATDLAVLQSGQAGTLTRYPTVGPPIDERSAAEVGDPRAPGRIRPAIGAY
jgi:hypothetical protein